MTNGLLIRIPLSAKQRFEILSRDNFTCLYCGVTPDRGMLHVDHVMSVADGGDNSPSNLRTACRDCNLGKGRSSLAGDAEKEARERRRYPDKHLFKSDFDLLFQALKRKFSIQDCVGWKYSELISSCSDIGLGIDKIGWLIEEAESFDEWCNEVQKRFYSYIRYEHFHGRNPWRDEKQPWRAVVES